MPKNCEFRAYCFVDWVKFCIPVLTSGVALALCLILILDCKSSIYASNGWLGLFFHATDSADSCVAYGRDSLELPNDPQFRTAQVSALVVVILLGFPLWLVLIMTMFWSQLNGVWSKIISITMSLVAGNVQLLSVVKFVRFALFAYPEEHVRYHRRYVVFGSILLWFATAFSISLCGVKQTSSTSSTSRTTEQDRVKHCQSAPEDGHVIVQTTNGILKSSSGDTQITRDLTTNEILNSSSGDTQILRGLEEGAIGLSASSVEGTIVTDGTDNIEGIEVELSMSASGEGTLASF